MSTISFVKKLTLENAPQKSFPGTNFGAPLGHLMRQDGPFRKNSPVLIRVRCNILLYKILNFGSAVRVQFGGETVRKPIKMNISKFNYLNWFLLFIDRSLMKKLINK